MTESTGEARAHNWFKQHGIGLVAALSVAVWCGTLQADVRNLSKENTRLHVALEDLRSLGVDIGVAGRIIDDQGERIRELGETLNVLDRIAAELQDDSRELKAKTAFVEDPRAFIREFLEDYKWPQASDSGVQVGDQGATYLVLKNKSGGHVIRHSTFQDWGSSEYFMRDGLSLAASIGGGADMHGGGWLSIFDRNGLWFQANFPFDFWKRTPD